MSFSRTLILVSIVSFNIFGILPSDLVFTPYSEFPEKNQTELGYQLSYYTIQGTTDDKGIYFHHSFSKNIRYGAEFYTGSDKYQVFHHFSYRLGSILEKSNFNLIFSGAINYLSTEKPVLNNENVYESSLTTSWKLLNSPFQFHLTVARKIFSDKFVGMFGATFHKEWGILALEWDAGNLNLSSQFEINDRIKVRGGITKNTKDATELLFKAGLGFVDFDILPKQTKEEKEELKIKEINMATVNTAVGLKHIQEGLQFYYEGEYRKAQKSYEIAVEFFPKSAIVRERLGSIYYKLNEFEKAQIQWEKANILTPSARLERYIRDAREKGESLYE